MISHWFFEIYHHFPGRSTISFRSIKQNVGQLHARLAKTRPTKTPGACGNSEPKPKSLKRWASSIDGSFNKTRMSRVETGDFLRISGEKNIWTSNSGCFLQFGRGQKVSFFLRWHAVNLLIFPLGVMESLWYHFKHLCNLLHSNKTVELKLCSTRNGSSKTLRLGKGHVHHIFQKKRPTPQKCPNLYWTFSTKGTVRLTAIFRKPMIHQKFPVQYLESKTNF